MKLPESPGLGFGSAGTAAAAAGWPGVTAAAAAAGAGRRRRKPGGGSPSNATCRWSWCAPSVKNPSAPIAHGVPTSVGLISPVISAISVASSRAAGLPEFTISPSTRAMSMPRPSKWLDTEPPEVNWSWPVLITESSILCFSVSLSSSAIIRGSTDPSPTSFCASASSTRFLFSSSALAAASPPPPTASAALPPAAGSIAAGGGDDRGGGLDRRRSAGGRRVLEQPLGRVELLLVAAAELLGGALDVGDPLAEGVGVVDRLAGGDALRLDGLGLVEEPLHLQLGLLRVAGVLALVPDPDAHLEEPDRVGVAEVEVLHARLDERRHHRELGREPAVLRVLGHPGRDLLLGRVVAGVGVGDPGEVARHGGRAGRRGLGGGRGRRRLVGLHRHERRPSRPSWARRSRGGVGLDGEEAAGVARLGLRLGRHRGGRRGLARGHGGRCRGRRSGRL